MTLTLKGKTQLASAWAKEVGIPLATITSRKVRGWTDEKTLTEPVFSNDTKITKNDCELYLNEVYENYRAEFSCRATIKLFGLAPISIKKPGQYIRRFFPKEFDRYFNEVYKPKKQDEIESKKHGDVS